MKRRAKNRLISAVTVASVLAVALVVHVRSTGNSPDSGQQTMSPHPQNEGANFGPRESIQRIANVVRRSRIARNDGTASFKTLTQQDVLQLEVQGELDAPSRGIQVSPQDERYITEIYIKFRSIRALYEQQIVEEIGFDGKTLKLRIPAYPEAGRMMRDMFYSELAQQLDPDVFRMIDERLGSYFDQRFLGFGITDQIIEVATAGTHADELEVSRTAVKKPGLTTWGVEEIGGFGASTSSARIRKSDLLTDEFDPIAPHVNRRFN